MSAFAQGGHGFNWVMTSGIYLLFQIKFLITGDEREQLCGRSQRQSGRLA